MFNLKSLQNLIKTSKNSNGFSTKMPLLVLSILVFIVYLSSFNVYQGQTALVFSMGELIEMTQKTGLHFKLPTPLASVTKIDRRIQTFSIPNDITIKTLDQKSIVIGSFVQWRIFNPKIFYLRFKGNTADAEQLIATTVRDAMNPVLSQRNFKAIMADDRDAISTNIRRVIYAKLIDIGLEVVDVRLKYIDFVPEIMDSVFERMKSEQSNAVKQQYIQGETASETIRLQAKGESDKITAEAYQTSQAIKGEGDAAASAVYADTVGNNTEFYNFYRSLEAYRAILSSKQDLLVLDSSSEFFKYFRSPSGK
ncbi:MAG: protease modulator HflC [Pseudomonadota bacterium]|jgi:membrane protease subunit HflC